MWLLEYNLSVAGAVGFIALSGVAAEFGVIMVLYLNHALDKYRSREPDGGNATLMRAIHEGAVLRVRPKVMTVATIMAGLLPIMWGWQWFRSDATHCSPDGGWDGDGTSVVDAGYSRAL